MTNKVKNMKKNRNNNNLVLEIIDIDGSKTNIEKYQDNRESEEESEEDSDVEDNDESEYDEKNMTVKILATMKII